MRTRILTALSFTMLVLATAACEKTPKDRLQGKWLGDSVENIPSDQMAKATGWVRGTAVEFQGNKVTVTIPAESPRRGSYQVSQVDGDRVTVSFTREEGGRDEARFRFAGDQQLRWDIGEGREIVLMREKKN